MSRDQRGRMIEMEWGAQQFMRSCGIRMKRLGLTALHRSAQPSVGQSGLGLLASSACSLRR